MAAVQVAVLRALFAIVSMLAIWVGPERTAAAQGVLSPGPLSRSHTSLEGDTNCSQCHSSGKRIEASNCLKCHADLGARIAAGAGLHGREYKGRPCEACHVEHQGLNVRLIRWPGGDPTRLDHAQTGWPLQNAHRAAAATSCNKCHNRTNARGAPTFLGLSSACNSCHKDPHDNRFGPVCTSCHDDASWKSLRLQSFNHDLARFKLRGAHQKVVCAKCHSEPPRFTGLKFDTCTSCHKDPHAGKLGVTCTGCHNENAWRPATLKPSAHPGTSLANGHASVACRTCHDRGNLVAPSRGIECVSCHKPVHKAPFGSGCATCHAPILWVGLPVSVGLGAHGRTIYPLTGKHQQAGCAGCHKPNVPRASRYRGLKFGRCGDCHADQHAGEFAKSFGTECRQCHVTVGFRPTSFDAAMHAKTAFPIVGKHIATACSACHTASTRPRLDLHIAKQACADCHQNPHGDHFATEMKDGGCAHCHKPAGWDLPKLEHTIWPLTGAHSSARCESCHSPTAEDRRSGTGPSWRNVPTACAGCHDDVHAGQFNTKEARTCDSCHGTTMFKIPDFDHAKLTKYPLTGGHFAKACSKCHSPVKLKKELGEVIRWRLPTTECNFCHADPHVKGERRGS